jgi:aminopeptidase N
MPTSRFSPAGLRRPALVLLLGGALAASALTAATASSDAPTTARAAAAPTPGAPGVRDRLFPTLGNGGYDVGSYALTMTYPSKDPRATVTGTVVIKARATQALSRFNLDFAGRSVGSVSVDGRKAAWTWKGEELTVRPAKPLADGAAFTVTVAGFRTTPATPRPGALLDAPFFATPDGTALAAQPNGAHRYFPSNDHPQDKATYTFTIRTPAGTRAVTNGVRTAVTTSGKVTTWRFAQRQPMASELLQVVVGNFTVTGRGTRGGVQVRDVTPKRLTRALLPRLAVELQQLDWMTAKVGKYPFDSYGSLVVDSPLGFALETQTLSLYGASLLDRGVSNAVLYPVLTHELAHQWFGDSVSPKVWSDLWLNEGHATWYQETYAEEKGYLAKETGYATLEALMREVYSLGDQWRAQWGPVARPASSDVEELFSPNVYYGGALALYALRQEIGAESFAELQRRWVTDKRGTSASTDDFVALASEVAGRDLRTFLVAWLYGTRTPPMPGHPDWTVAATSTSAVAQAAPRTSAFTRLSEQAHRHD